jgi:mRNA-binding protein PUF3
VWDAIASPFANFVLQKSISIGRPHLSQYVIDEIMSVHGGSVRASQHKYGCRIIQRLLEHCREDQAEGIIEEILTHALVVSKSQFGMHVIRHVIENGSEQHQHRLLDIMIVHGTELATDTYGRSVLSSAVSIANEHQVGTLRRLLLKNQEALSQMVQCRNGYCGAIDILGSLPDSERKALWHKLVEQTPEIPCSRYGQMVAGSIHVSST